MPQNQRISDLEGQWTDLRKKLMTIGPIIRGSIVQYARLCGKSNCHCVTGKRHVSTFLSITVEGKTINIYLKKNTQKIAQQWSSNYKQFSDITEQISNINIQRLKALSSLKPQDDNN